MFRWLKSLFAWVTVSNTGVWAYGENKVTGRRAVDKVGPGHQPLDIVWLCEDELYRGEPKVNGIPISRTGYRLLYMNYQQDADYREALSALRSKS